jgi:hypothetical protein
MAAAKTDIGVLPRSAYAAQLVARDRIGILARHNLQ